MYHFWIPRTTLSPFVGRHSSVVLKLSLSCSELGRNRANAISTALHHLAVPWEGRRADGSSFPTRQYKNGSAALRSSAHPVEWSKARKRSAEAVREFSILDADGNLLTFEEPRLPQMNYPAAEHSDEDLS